MNTIKFAKKLAIPLFVALAYGPAQGLAQSILDPNLASFAVLGSSTVTNTGATVITGKLGLAPAPAAADGVSVTGFSTLLNTVVNGPGSTGLIDGPGLVSGTINIRDTFATLAQGQLTTAYNTLAGLSFLDLTGHVLGNGAGGTVSVLTPGVYRFSSSAQLNGALTLNALNDPNALFVFQIGSTLTTASSSSVNVINAVPGAGVFWNVGSSATLGSGTSFEGNILALASIGLDPFAQITCGRALADNGAVTMSGTNKISIDCLGTGEELTGGLGSVTHLPEPETYAMLLAGLGLMGFVARRRQRNLAAAA